MRRTVIGKATVITALVAVSLAAISAVSPARAQQPAMLDFNVTENRVPGADGTGTITPLPGDQLRVEVRLTGLPPNGEHAMHIHLGDGARCDTNAPIVYPLNNVQVDGAGVGTSATTITLRPDQPVRAGNAYVNVHQAPTVPSPGVICANIDTTFAAGATGEAAPAPAPGGTQMPSALARTGTGLQADAPLAGWWLAVATLIGLTVIGTAASLARVRRRR
jgi:hypothetical protein